MAKLGLQLQHRPVDAAGARMRRHVSMPLRQRLATHFLELDVVVCVRHLQFIRACVCVCFFFLKRKLGRVYSVNDRSAHHEIVLGYLPSFFSLFFLHCPLLLFRTFTQGAPLSFLKKNNQALRINSRATVRVQASRKGNNWPSPRALKTSRRPSALPEGNVDESRATKRGQRVAGKKKKGEIYVG